MKNIHVRNVQDALPEVLVDLNLSGVTNESRNGTVTMFPFPVITTYERPDERVMFWAERDANPFFHLMEALWMLGGDDRVDFPSMFAPNLLNYSDDGKTFNGAYGYRWRRYWGYDQLLEVISLLSDDPTTRRAVIQIWSASDLTNQTSKDLPCNTSVMFQVNPSTRKLDMTVTNRSNDIVWGAYGANAVHFSMLHELVATAAGIPLGRYYQFSNNLHAYQDTLKQVSPIAEYAGNAFLPKSLREVMSGNPYTTGKVKPHPIMSVGLEDWMYDLDKFLLDPEDKEGSFIDPFFRDVARPMYRAWAAWKFDREDDDPLIHFEYALEEIRHVAATDWRLAGQEWLTRRYKKAQAKKRAEDDGVSYES